MTLTLRANLTSFCLIASAAQLFAAPPDAAKFAVTDAATADADFALQGEYLGLVTLPSGAREFAGLQVVALGNGKFEAVYLKGGLPAAGWNKKNKTKLKGEGNAGRLALADDTVQLDVSAAEATVHDRNGRELGRLDKIRRISPTLDAPPPAGATVLFGNGSPGQNGSAEQFDKGTVTSDGLLNAGTTTKLAVDDFRLHLEFRTPYMPYARGQGRGNSGVYIQQRYEVQVLDSFGLDGAFNECGSLYRQRAPSVNNCLPPLAWQTYDIFFTAARWSAAKEKTAAARLTVLLNGEPVQDNVEIAAKTGAGKAEGPEPFPINLQNHGNPVHYRNIWILTGSGASAPPASQDGAAVGPVSFGPVTSDQCTPDTYRRRRVGWR